MAELLFEIGTEDLPSWYVSQARDAIIPLLQQRLAKAQLDYGAMQAYATPRRIAVRVHDVAEQSSARSEKKRGPAADVAFDNDGQPSKAMLGFARANGVDVAALSVEDTDKGRYVFVSKQQGGEAAKTLLPELLCDLVGNFPAPRKMRWGDVQLPFVRPIAWFVALLDDTLLAFDCAGLSAGNTSQGHRFLAPGSLVLQHAQDYPEALEQAFVIADIATRQERTWQAVQAAADAQQLSPLHDETLLAEVASLIEYPFGVLGSFNRRYLELPEEVLITVMIHHQRFFPLRQEDGSLAPHFVSVSNNRVPDEAVIRKGYEQVLEGRLADARFFWEADRRKSLSQHAWGLAGIGFQKELGSMADKMGRVEHTCQELAKLLDISADERDILDKAVPVFRADLSTEMIYQLPELEGVMGRAYALAEGYAPEVAEVLEHGVRPHSTASALPTSNVAAILAAADRLDKLVGFFAIGKRPSGSADPFGLRRDAIALARILNARGWPYTPAELIAVAASAYEGSKVSVRDEALDDLDGFVWDRVGVLLADEGIATPLLRAATADRPSVIKAARRSHLLQRLSQEAEFADLLALYKRASNLLHKASDLSALHSVDTSRFQSPYAAPLHEALPKARNALATLLQLTETRLAPWDLGRGTHQQLGELSEDVLLILALKAPLDAFLDNVLVMVDDEVLRYNRLALLANVCSVFADLGDLEKLEGV